MKKRKITAMMAMVSAARGAGFSVQLIGKLLNTSLCPECNKLSLVTFDHEDGRCVKGCPCGYRYKVLGPTESTPKQIVEEEGRCQALTKKGLPCKNKAQAGSCFCGLHNK